MNGGGSAKRATDERMMGRDELVLMDGCRWECPEVPPLETIGTEGQQHAVLPCEGAAILALACLHTQWLGLLQKPS